MDVWMDGWIRSKGWMAKALVGSRLFQNGTKNKVRVIRVTSWQAVVPRCGYHMMELPKGRWKDTYEADPEEIEKERFGVSGKMQNT